MLLQFFETVVDREVLQFWDALDQKHKSSFEFFWSENNRFLVCTMTNRHHRLQARARRDRQVDVKLSPPDLSCCVRLQSILLSLMEWHWWKTIQFLQLASWPRQAVPEHVSCGNFPKNSNTYTIISLAERKLSSQLPQVIVNYDTDIFPIPH